MIDSAQEDNLPQIKNEIENLVNNDNLRDGVFLFLANKQDIANALNK